MIRNTLPPKSPRNRPEMISPVKTWLVSFLRHGYGIIPVGKGTWFKQALPLDYGDIAMPTSVWLPIGRLYVIPTVYQDEYFRRLRKAMSAKSILGFLLGIGILAPVLSENLNDGVGLFVLLVAASFIFGALVPLWISAVQLQRVIRSKSLRINPIGSVARQIRAFNFLFGFLVFLYRLLQGLITTAIEARADKRSNISFEKAKGAFEDSFMSYFQHAGNRLAAVGLAIAKTAGGLMLLFVSTWGLVSLLDWIVQLIWTVQIENISQGLPQSYDPRTVIAVCQGTGMGLALIGGLVWGHTYLKDATSGTRTRT